MLKLKKMKPTNVDPSYRKIWKVVDGCFRSLYDAHPEYFNEKKVKDAQRSLVKRVTGALANGKEKAG